MAWRDNGTFNRALVEEAPDCFIAHASLGVWYFFGRPPDPGRAREHFAQALRIEDRTPRALAVRLGFAATYDVEGQRDKAIEKYREIIELAPDHPRAEDARRRLGELESTDP